MNKKSIANWMMIGAVLAVLAAGILTVGFLKGWFDRGDGQQAVVTGSVGIVTLERAGLSTVPEADLSLRKGDLLQTGPKAQLTVHVGDAELVLGEQTRLTVENALAEQFCASVAAGEVFLTAGNGQMPSLKFGEYGITAHDCVIWVCVDAQTQSLYVCDGSVDCAGQRIARGEYLHLTHGAAERGQLQVQMLDDFCTRQVRRVNETRALCVTNGQLDAFALQKEQALEQIINGETTPDGSTEPSEPSEPEETRQPAGAEQPTGEQQSPPPVQTTQPDSQPVDETECLPDPEPASTCTITIRCDTVLNNMDRLDPAKAGYIPANGVILSTVTVSFTPGESVYDVLRRVCGSASIALEASWSPVYDSYYVEGIGHLYEFDCGSGSGWLYQVNGQSPNYGCSGYLLSDGDNIRWDYTCNMGEDLGG